jgi:hypothetical protein
VTARWAPEEAVELAASSVKQAGFEFVNSSMKSVACYYRYPGRLGFLRISDHSKRKHNERFFTEPVASSLSFCIAVSPRDGKFEMSKEQIETRVAHAIGRYMMRAARPAPDRSRQ